MSNSSSTDSNGFLQGVALISSANCDERPKGAEIELLVVHNISLPPGEFGGPGIIDFFTNRLDPNAHPYYQTIKDLKVSSHFLIRRDGEIIQFVPCAKRAWHAGVSSWRGCECCNDFSIGIELEGCDDQPFEAIQYEKLAELVRTLKDVFPIRDIVGHSDIAPGRKTDPGPCFDWERFRGMLAVQR
ncbi:MAG TPA: 1,6-anhydro-N-acetylmuramyl-L-alanine amidase AmpD [Burkholderiales bacterium]|nr:1,6-anhydro-N-acetylmuramyl-L-alanine amidase AmpD [Burkholderiales bacterium]